ncbi:uroporphyrinogen-III C-methyltransferase [Coralliovum pocilloporae]|uniref:uroporphyrinogen-III C-methyltransferase n=1 Tax=Coralliovum pocilloporae TaxID=3066369 RepID=UPI0033073A49
MKRIGTVSLIGGGPGDPELLTVKALRRIEQAEAVVYDRLISKDILDLVPPRTALYPVGKTPRNHPVPQHEINQMLVDLARSGLRVVRLKGGDPFIFGRGSEEALALVEAEVPFEIVPGITAAQGCASQLGVPLTHRGLATGVRYVTGHCREDKPLDLDWKSLADPDTTLVVYMGLSAIGQISHQLIAHGLDSETPVMAVSRGTTPDECHVTGTLATIAEQAKAAALPSPTLFMIGEVTRLGNILHPERLKDCAEVEASSRRPARLEVVHG